MLAKGYLRESISPCAILVLFMHNRKRSSWYLKLHLCLLENSILATNSMISFFILVLPKCIVNLNSWASLNTFSFKALSSGKYIFLPITTIPSSKIWKGFSTPNFTMFVTLSTSMSLHWTSKTLSKSKNHTLNCANNEPSSPISILALIFFQFH